MLAFRQLGKKWSDHTKDSFIKQFGLKQWFLCHYVSGENSPLSSLPSSFARLKNHHHYHTAFGPVFYGDWIIYENCRENLDRAITRMTTSRDLEFDRRRAQKIFFTSRRGPSRILHSLLRVFKDSVTQRLSGLHDAWCEQKLYASKAHPKRNLRIRAMQELIDSALESTCYTKKIKGKVKLFERAKPGKMPRLIGDYTCPGSLLAGFLCEIAKDVAPTFHMRRLTTRFSGSTDATSLNNLGNTFFRSNRNEHVHFSDDSIIKIGGKYYNLDISSCDKSNLTPVFDSLAFLFSDLPQFHQVIRKAIQQCHSTFTIHDPNSKLRVNLNPKWPSEFSGTTLTTLLNVLASYSIGVALEYYNPQCIQDIIAACAFAGYDVTVEECTRVEHVQFLKHSWYLHDEEYHSFLNLGPILRSFGTCLGDLPGKGELTSRAYVWNSTIISAYCHSGKTRVQEILESQYKSSSRCRLPYDIEKHSSGVRRPSTPCDRVCARYGFSQAEWTHFLALVESSDLFSTIRHTCITKIFLIDYGLKDGRSQTTPLRGVGL